MNKKLGLIIAAGALSASLIVGSTLAWFTDDERATNTLTMGKVDIELYEEDKLINEETPGLTFDNLVPGATVDKLAEVKNAGTVDAYVRVQLSHELTVEKDINLSNMLDINSSDWVLEDDGFYYYNGVVNPNDFTTPIFTTVTLPGSGWGNEMVEAEFSIYIHAEAIQVDNFYPVAGGTFTTEGLANAWNNQ